MLLVALLAVSLALVACDSSGGDSGGNGKFNGTYSPSYGGGDDAKVTGGKKIVIGTWEGTIEKAVKSKAPAGSGASGTAYTATIKNAAGTDVGSIMYVSAKAGGQTYKATTIYIQDGSFIWSGGSSDD